MSTDQPRAETEAARAKGQQPLGDGGITSSYEADGLGSITTLTDSSGAVAATYTYDSFGNLTASTGTVTNPFRYTARELDNETGLYYYRARYYDPTVGRFISEDPLGFEAAQTWYVYVTNNPITEIDPLGLVQRTYNVSTHTLDCTSDDGSQRFTTNRVRSGQGNCQNNPACSPVPRRGPIPPGDWNLGRLGDTPPHRVPRVPITPRRGTNAQGRTRLQVHPGGPNSSQGCIALDPAEYQRFMRFYIRDNGGDLTVQ